MELRIQILCIFFFLSVLIHTGSGIDCWVCTSADDGCGEVISSVTLQSNLKTGSGCKACGKDFKSLGTLFSSVERTCLTSASDTCVNNLGYGSCTCTTTFCNGQSRTFQSSNIVLAVLLCFVFKIIVNY